ncbi:Rad21/Rec8 like protein [Cordyceps fumosorosea ARSEF 2679]|uniref:Rad21/Rec8 like protein n=1 Tax=Cordyceps fumosorosea (strain ARSEF 2679) TaxID=1081104 RepID=A0A167MC24_CORFA|nr:Rad21/Rec8 like protein [Cordyceps fumosorosea ARSEF 2679]OAA54186.1 Rad21/Rec8 like protein [Cordyceps fumosorosea ARSEF 2679]
MFYSNQILTSTQYGVSTIWLVATVGKSNQKRVNKRAIQDVNVPRACGKILDPGAPLALRLQGNLLYGVSKVFADQCGYLLSDTEKTQSDMMTFFRAMKSSHLDLPSTKTKRVSITLQDDPNFDPMSQLPPLDLGIIDTDWLAIPSQGSATKFSQMSPLQAYTSRRGSVNRHTSLINLELPPSSHSPGSYRLPAHLGQSSSPYAKLGDDFDDRPAFIPTQDDEFDAIAGIGLNFDGEGNLIEAIEEEPELPPFFGDMPSNVSMPASGAQPLQPLDDFLMMNEEQALPEAEAFPAAATQAASNENDRIVVLSDENGTLTTTETVQQAAHAKRRRVARNVSMIDEVISLPRSQQKHWLNHYADIMASETKRQDGTTAAQAKKNALAFVLQNDLAEVGLSFRATGVVHPLANTFSGWNVLSQLNPEAFGQPEPETPRRTSRRRKSEEAFGDEDPAAQEQQQQRNLRPRHDLDDPAETGRGQQAGETMAPPPPPAFPSQDDSYFEMGMDALPAMADQHSSSIMPWSRPGSAAPGSSIRGGGAAAPGSAQNTAPSPLLHRSTNLVAGLDRHSDPVVPATPSQVTLELSALDSLFMDMDAVINFDDAVYAGLDAASRGFLDYASKRAVLHGEDGESQQAGDRRRWVEFERIVSPMKHDGAVAAQAFLHVLALATRGIISVRQDNNADGTQAFGAIHVGIELSLSGQN